MMTNLFHDLNIHKYLERSFVRNSLIFAQGTKSIGVLYVIKGAVKLVRHTITGHRVSIHTAGAGETVAEASLFSATYHCDCIAIEDSIIKFINKQNFLNLLSEDPALNKKFMKHLADQTIGYRRRIELFTMKGAKEKVMAALADNVKYRSIIDLASYLGLTHEVTYRALADLTRAGSLEKIGRGKYKVVSVD